MPVRKISTRSALTVAGGAVAFVLAALLALLVNIGILGAAGSPPGPGRLDQTSVERPVHRAAPSPKPEGTGRAREDRSPVPVVTPMPSPWQQPSSSSSPQPGASQQPRQRDGRHREREFGSGADD